MSKIARPWTGVYLDEEQAFTRSDCLLSEVRRETSGREQRDLLMKGQTRGQDALLFLHPYPKRAEATGPTRTGFPVRPKSGSQPRDDEETFAHDTFRRMNEVVARVQELQDALDDPANVWLRLREAWKRAEDEKDPRMAEIVKQARNLMPVLKDLEKRIRRILRRERELTPMDRAQEMDRKSLLWLTRQPGRNMRERGGASQRVQSIVRRENFDTLENRVVRSYARLAEMVAREWINEHPRARESTRFKSVDAYRKFLKSLSRDLTALGVGVAAPPVTPNYVLMQDKGYRQIYKAWVKLLRREKALDELWAWQAQTWTDFVVLAIVLALDELDEAELVAQSPIVWNEEAVSGRAFDQGRPIAIFWLKKTGRVVEVMARPEEPGAVLTLARAHVALRVVDPSGEEFPRRVAVWTPHAMEEIDLAAAAQESCDRVWQIDQGPSTIELLRDGLIVAPSHGVSRREVCQNGRVKVEALSLGASGGALAKGMDAIRTFVRSGIYLGAQ